MWGAMNKCLLSITPEKEPILLSSVVVRQHLSTEVPGSIPGGGSVTDTISQWHLGGVWQFVQQERLYLNPWDLLVPACRENNSLPYLFLLQTLQG